MITAISLGRVSEVEASEDVEAWCLRFELLECLLALYFRGETLCVLKGFDVTGGGRNGFRQTGHALAMPSE